MGGQGRIVIDVVVRVTILVLRALVQLLDEPNREFSSPFTLLVSES